MIYLNLDSNFKKVKKFNINDNGIQLSEDDINMEFRVDVFRSQPLFIFTDKLNNLHIFDKMEYFYENSSFTQKIDIVGFWEIILFGTSLWTRTLYQNLIQLPSASSLIINKKTQRFTITRYWDFNVQKNNQIKSIDDASIILNKKLENISMKLDKNKVYSRIEWRS